MFLRTISSITRILVHIESRYKHDIATCQFVECPDNVFEAVTGPLTLGRKLS